MKKQLLIHLTEEEHEFLRVEAFETEKSMASILRAGLDLYRKQKEEGKVTKELTFKEKVEQAREKVEEEMKRVGFIDDSDNTDRFLDNLSQELAKEEILKGNEDIDFYYEKEDEIEQLQEKLLEEIRDKIMNQYNRFYECKNGQYEGCYYETTAGLKAWKEA